MLMPATGSHFIIAMYLLTNLVYSHGCRTSLKVWNRPVFDSKIVLTVFNQYGMACCDERIVIPSTFLYKKRDRIDLLGCKVLVIG